MQEITKNDIERVSELSRNPDERDKQILKAVNDPNNKSVLIHKPGSVMTLQSGRQYLVMEDGSWKRVPEGKQIQ